MSICLIVSDEMPLLIHLCGRTEMIPLAFIQIGPDCFLVEPQPCASKKERPFATTKLLTVIAWKVKGCEEKNSTQNSVFLKLHYF